MMPRKQLVIGSQFGSWTVIADLGTGNVRGMYKCRCVCGREAPVAGTRLRNGKSPQCRSCGMKECATKRPLAAAYRRVCGDPAIRFRLRRRIRNIFHRCLNDTNINYDNYGGRGIRVHPPWLKRPASFMAYLMTLPGHDDPDLSIDRINNDGNYEPGNLRFATDSQQAYNRRPRRWAVKPKPETRNPKPERTGVR